ncbi:DMT family transporter [Microbulbifer celer]|uniref:DMT family transporter n=1 Tax=Microbulbifer celer TaxID=435905 RepID=A0ABW3U8P1_9GAMM|nr:DMT family transporter [Microbulbifer celer]UFN58414.1 DMT family transporter [Microbulbifer celer]
MKEKQAKAELLLLCAALFWGIAFVPQKMAMAHMPPLAFNAWRFLLGGLILIPLVYWLSSRREVATPEKGAAVKSRWRDCMGGGAMLGFWLFLGAALQQWGLVYTSAGRAGFISGMEMLLVSLIGLSFGLATNRWTWAGMGLALSGLYVLGDFSQESQMIGDLLVFAGAFAFAIQVLTADRLVSRYHALRLAAIQFLFCGLFSALASLLVEQATLQGAVDAAWPIAYMMIFSTAVAFTFQLLGLRHAATSHATVIMSLESVFALLAGWLILSEVFTGYELLGCGLMLSGMLLSRYGTHAGSHH